MGETEYCFYANMVTMFLLVIIIFKKDKNFFKSKS